MAGSIPVSRNRQVELTEIVDQPDKGDGLFRIEC